MEGNEPTNESRSRKVWYAIKLTVKRIDYNNAALDNGNPRITQVARRSHATFVLALEGRGSNEEVYLSDLNALEKI